MALIISTTNIGTSTPTIEQLELEYTIRNIISDVDFRNYTFYYDIERQLLQAGFDGWKTRKWWISEHATKSEILQTVLMLILASVEHEAREDFTYRGRAIYGPHINKESLYRASLDIEERPL